jgi:peptide chain release factor subunit 1
VAGTVSWQALRELASFRAERGCAISLYLNLDPRLAPTAGDVDTRFNALLNAGEKTQHRAELTHDQRQGLREDFARIRRYFDADFNRDGARGLVVFADKPDNFWRRVELIEPVPDVVKAGREFYVAPLVPLVGRGDGAIVAVVGREQGRVYSLRGGRLEEMVDRTEDQPGRHDQGGWSQANYQRHIEKLVQEHLKGVAGELDRRARRFGRPKIVLVSSGETRAEFTEELSHETRSAIVGATQAEAHATPAELLEVVRPILDKAHVEDEADAVARWREEAGRNGRAAAGWGQTLEAASDGRVELLLFQEGANHQAWQCPACGRASLAGGSCPLDGTRMEPRDDGLDLAVHQTLAHGGTVWAVRHHHDLEPVEGIGALLRY